MIAVSILLVLVARLVGPGAAARAADFSGIICSPRWGWSEVSGQVVKNSNHVSLGVDWSGRARRGVAWRCGTVAWHRATAWRTVASFISIADGDCGESRADLNQRLGAAWGRLGKQDPSESLSPGAAGGSRTAGGWLGGWGLARWPQRDLVARAGFAMHRHRLEWRQTPGSPFLF